MKKHYKTDYLKKLCQLSKICNDNFSYVYKILTSQQFPAEKMFQKSKNIITEIKENLNKDYFTPFEREDIFIISRKLHNLNEYSYFIFKFLSDNRFFSSPKNIIQQIGYLIKITETIHEIFINLSATQKADSSLYITEAETVQEELIHHIYDSINNDKTLNYGTILHYIENCADTANEIIQMIQYTLLKNS